MLMRAFLQNSVHKLTFKSASRIFGSFFFLVRKMRAEHSAIFVKE